LFVGGVVDVALVIVVGGGVDVVCRGAVDVGLVIVVGGEVDVVCRGVVDVVLVIVVGGGVDVGCSVLMLGLLLWLVEELTLFCRGCC
jgi:hypothetical protein